MIKQGLVLSQWSGVKGWLAHDQFPDQVVYKKGFLLLLGSGEYSISLANFKKG